MKSPKFLKYIHEHEIVRRYVIMNSFDGALTILGIIVASFFAGIREPFFVILPSFGAAIAMCVSGMWGAYAAEIAETKRSIRHLEKHLLRKLKGTKLEKTQYKMAIIIAVFDGMSPLIVSLFIISPFVLSAMGRLDMASAYYASLGLIAGVLFSLGSFTGKIAKENRIMQGIIMLFAGLVIGAIFYIFMLLGLL